MQHMPDMFRVLPPERRIQTVRRRLGPAGGWFMRDRIVGKIETLTNLAAESARIEDGKVALRLTRADGSHTELRTDHVVSATGYRVDLRKLPYLDPAMLPAIKELQGSPLLSRRFESTIPGLYFVGLPAAYTFGPVMRFAVGAEFTAPHQARHLAR
jgi:hypothetical protein